MGIAAADPGAGADPDAAGPAAGQGPPGPEEPAQPGGSGRDTRCHRADLPARRPGARPAAARRLPRRPGGGRGVPPVHRVRTASGKAAAAQTVLATLPAEGGQVRLSAARTRRRGWARSTTCGWRWAPGSDVTEDSGGAGGRPAGRTRARPISGSTTGWLPPGAPWCARCGDSAAGYARSHADDRPATLHAKIVAHARADHPDEACGVIAGPAGQRPARAVRPDGQRGRSPTFYEFDSVDQLRVYREMDDRDEEPVVVYHSHTATEAYPSRTDISYASEPDAHYVLVSTRDPDADGVPLVPDRGRRGHRGRSPGRRRDVGPGRNDRPAARLELPENCTARTPSEPHPGATFDGHRGPHPDDPAQLHRRREGRRGRRRHPRRAVRRPGRPAPAGCASGWSTTAGCAGSSTSTSTTRTCGSSAGWTRRSPTATR